MVDIPAILSGFKAAMDTLGGIKALDTEVKVNQAKAELTKHLVEAQATIMTLHADNISLTARATQIEEWSHETKRYALKEWDGGALVYELKGDHADGEPPHAICPSCFTERKKSILQPLNHERRMYRCDSCKAHYRRLQEDRIVYSSSTKTAWN